jgi:hypothetical protein
MSYELRIHVPESVADSVRSELINNLTREYGGTTIYEYTGTWVNDNDQVERENGHIVTCLLSGVEESARAAWVRRWYVAWFKDKTQERAIMSDVRETNATIG